MIKLLHLLFYYGFIFSTILLVFYIASKDLFMSINNTRINIY